jgi:hypothetical protein
LIRPRDQQRSREIVEALSRPEEPALPGIAAAAARDVLVAQILESVHRVRVVPRWRSRRISEARRDPHSNLFDPVRGAIWHSLEGDFEEACWLVYLFVHFGKHRTGGYRYARDVYGRLGSGRWDWRSVRSRLRGFRNWLRKYETELRRSGSGFGSHRKYQSLDADSATGTGAAVESYVRWVTEGGSHHELIARALVGAEGDPKAAFERLYVAMTEVKGFGRTARFDYLCMLGKIGLAGIEPGRAYLSGATGPLAGARLLFGGARKASLAPMDLEKRLQDLDARVGVGMQVWEDALCNWQKSPTRFVRFRG